MSFLQLFAQDAKGDNFYQLVTNIDIGYEEFWSSVFFWEDEVIHFCTQYNPPFLCDEVNCMHFPRNHLDDGGIDFNGDIVYEGSDVCCP